jgi:YVTN family beta-propeller protein
VVKVIPVGAFPTDIALDPRTNRIYVANSEEDSVSVIDGDNNVLLEMISAGRCPVGIAVSPSRDEIYVTHSAAGGGALYVINTITRQKTEQLPVGSGLGNVAVDPRGERVLVAEEARGIRVIEAA